MPQETQTILPIPTWYLTGANCQAIAVLSFCPGGVTVFGQTYIGGTPVWRMRSADDTAASAYINDYLNLLKRKKQ